ACGLADEMSRAGAADTACAAADNPDVVAAIPPAAVSAARGLAEEMPRAGVADTASDLLEDIRPTAIESPLACATNAWDGQRGRPFEPGQSGNPSGRPKGSRNRVTKAIAALDGHSEELIAKAVELAMDGDSAMVRALVATFVPKTRDRTIEFDLPKIETAAD